MTVRISMTQEDACKCSLILIFILVTLSYSSFCELPECQVKVARNKACLRQLSCLADCPSVRMKSIHLVPITFRNLAYSPLTHHSITKPVLLRRLLDAALKDRGTGNAAVQQDTLLLRSVTRACIEVLFSIGNIGMCACTPKTFISTLSVEF